MSDGPTHSPEQEDGETTSTHVSYELPEAVDETWEEEVDEAFVRRPIFSIRMRIILGFGLFFLFSVVTNVWMILKLSEVRRKVSFLEIADDYLSEIQQARRYEKNFLLYGTNLDEALGHLHTAQSILSRNRSVVRAVLGGDRSRTMAWQLSDYEALLIELSPGASAEDRGPIETELRRKGAQMVSNAREFVDAERESVDGLMALVSRIPFYFLGILMVLMVFVAAFLIRGLLGTLSRFMVYTERIGQGDFSPITPKRKYQDEFSQLGRAMNRMIHELNHRQRILVESHKLRAMGTLVAGVAHELNNPLNNIMLTASLLSEDFETLDKAEKLEMLHDVVGETERSQKIVRNLLDFARESETSSEHLDLRQLLEQSARLVRNQIKLAKVRLRIDVPDDLPPIDGDRQMLSQVFVNLILNALDVLPRGGEIRIWARESLVDKGFVAVHVEDNGPGIPEHILSRIFDPFFTTKKRGKGSGLGLSVSRGIVRKLGGYIEVRSTVGHGTDFTVRLPVTDIPSGLSVGSGGSGSVSDAGTHETRRS